MSSHEKFWISFWAIVFVTIMVISGLISISSKNSDTARTAQIQACAAAGSEWRPVMPPGDKTVYMSCLRPRDITQ